MPVLRSLLIAFSTYSRIPVPQVEWTEENRRYAMCFFPLIGAVLGLILWGWLALCDTLRIGAFLRGAVAALGIPVTEVEVPDGGMLRDLDTPADYADVLKLLEQNK